MALLAILTGIVAVYIWRRHIPWIDLILLCSWGLLAATTPLGRLPADWLANLNTVITHWF